MRAATPTRPLIISPSPPASPAAPLAAAVAVALDAVAAAPVPDAVLIPEVVPVGPVTLPVPVAVWLGKPVELATAALGATVYSLLPSKQRSATSVAWVQFS